MESSHLSTSLSIGSVCLASLREGKRERERKGKRRRKSEEEREKDCCLTYLNCEPKEDRSADPPQNFA